jgi:hypothetical protein
MPSQKIRSEKRALHLGAVEARSEVFAADRQYLRNRPVSPNATAIGGLKHGFGLRE